MQLRVILDMRLCFWVSVSNILIQHNSLTYKDWTVFLDNSLVNVPCQKSDVYWILRKLQDIYRKLQLYRVETMDGTQVIMCDNDFIREHKTLQMEDSNISQSKDLNHPQKSKHNDKKWLLHDCSRHGRKNKHAWWNCKLDSDERSELIKTLCARILHSMLGKQWVTSDQTWALW